MKRPILLGIVGAVDTTGWVLGHLYGGIMVQFMSWPYLFWINLPVIALMFCVTWWGLAGLPRMQVKGGIDWIGVTLLASALVLLNVGLGSPELASTASATPPRQNQLYWIAGAAVAFVIFLMSQRRIKDPILELRIFSSRNVSVANSVNLLVGFCIMVALVSVPLFINIAGASDDLRKAALVTAGLVTGDPVRLRDHEAALGGTGRRLAVAPAILGRMTGAVAQLIRGEARHAGRHRVERNVETATRDVRRGTREAIVRRRSERTRSLHFAGAAGVVGQKAKFGQELDGTLALPHPLNRA